MGYLLAVFLLTGFLLKGMYGEDGSGSGSTMNPDSESSTTLMNTPSMPFTSSLTVHPTPTPISSDMSATPSPTTPSLLIPLSTSMEGGIITTPALSSSLFLTTSAPSPLLPTSTTSSMSAPTTSSVSTPTTTDDAGPPSSATPPTSMPPSFSTTTSLFSDDIVTSSTDIAPSSATPPSMFVPLSSPVPIASTSPILLATPSLSPLSTLEPSSSPTTISGTSTTSASQVPIPIIAGVGGGLVVGAICIILCCVAIVVRRKKRSSRFVLTTADSSHNVFPMYKGGGEGEDQADAFTSQPMPEEIINFGVNLTTDTFGIKSAPSSPAKTKGEKSGDDDDDENLPALVFINAVDPSIPVLSNTASYSQTLPSRHKIQRGDVLQASFEAPANVSRESLLSGEMKAAKSTGAINRVIASQPLSKNPQLDDLASQKVNLPCVQPPDGSILKQTEAKSSASKTSVARESDGYVFLQPAGKLPGKQDSSPTSQDPVTTNSSTPPTDTAKAGPTDTANSGIEDSHVMPRAEGAKTIVESLYDVPRAIVMANKEESVEANGFSPPTVDRSHYDVPRKLLLEARAAALKREAEAQENNQKEVDSSAAVASPPPADTPTPQPPADTPTLQPPPPHPPPTPMPLVTPTMLQEKLKRVPPAKPERKTSLINLKDGSGDNVVAKPSQSSIYDTPKSSKGDPPNQTQPPVGNLSSDAPGKGKTSSSTGIYDVPRSVMKEGDETTSSKPAMKQEGKTSPISSFSKPAVNEGVAASSSSKPNDIGDDKDKQKGPAQEKVAANSNSPPQSKDQANKPQVKPKPSKLQEKVQSAGPAGNQTSNNNNNSNKPIPLPRKSVKPSHPPLTRELALPLTEQK